MMDNNQYFLDKMLLIFVLYCSQKQPSSVTMGHQREIN